MANIIDLTNILQDIRKQPFNQSTLDFLQTSMLNQFDDLVKTLLIAARDNTDFTDKVVILWGVAITGIGEQNTEGAIFFNGEIYKVNAQGPLPAPTNVFVYAIENTFDPSDPQTFSDSLMFNVLQIRKVKIIDAVSGSGIGDVVGDVNVIDLEAQLITNLGVDLKSDIAQGSFQALAMGTDWFDTSFFIRKNDTGLVNLSGIIARVNSSTTTLTTIATLPDSTFRPLNVQNIGVILRSSPSSEVPLFINITSGTDDIRLFNDASITINIGDDILISAFWYVA